MNSIGTHKVLVLTLILFLINTVNGCYSSLSNHELKFYDCCRKCSNCLWNVIFSKNERNFKLDLTKNFCLEVMPCEEQSLIRHVILVNSTFHRDIDGCDRKQNVSDSSEYFLNLLEVQDGKNVDKLKLESVINVIEPTRCLESLFETDDQTTEECVLDGDEDNLLLINKLFLWMKLDVPNRFLNLSPVLQEQASYFKISPRLASHLSQEPGLIRVQFVVAQNKPFGWSDTGSGLVNQLVWLSIENRGGKRYKQLPAPIDLYFRYSKKAQTHDLTKGFGRVSSILHETEDNDGLVSVYRLDFYGSGRVFIRFHNITINRVQVLLSENVRPDYEMMVLLSQEISNESPLYIGKFENQTTNCVHYLGILPNINGMEEFSFEVRTIQCYSRSEMGWINGGGCYVGDETSEILIHCRCWHLSFFGGGVAISPRLINFESDLKLLLTVKDNPMTFITVTSILLLYLMILVWTRHNDSKDSLQRFVIVLEDNFPGEEWAYLVTVYTGFWIGSGTDANIGLRLYGSKGISRAHNLQSHQRKVLKANCDDWFLIFTPKSLGEIEKIHVFHDHSGSYPDWYCTKIMVYDLEGQKDFKFIVEKWMSLSEEHETIEYFFEPTPTQRSLRRDRIAIDNVIFGLRETHLLLSIFTRHPRSSVTRSQRLSICVCILMVHMLTNIMFYELEEAEYPQYSAVKKNIVIEMESTMLAAPFTFIIIFCFKKSRIVTVPKTNAPITLTSTQAVPLETGLEANQSTTQLVPIILLPSETSSGSQSSFTSTLSEEEVEEVEEEEAEGTAEEIAEGCWKNCYQQIKALLFQVITTKAVMPVKIAEEDDHSFRVRKQWMYFAWILCETSIFLSALFIIIYSLKMEHKKFKEWMHQSFKYSFSNIFLMAPIKIIIFATILAILYGQLQYVPSYECNTEIAMKREFIGNERFLTRILKLRSKKWYQPLSNKEKYKISLQEKNWRRWRIVINFVIIILLYLVLTVEVLSTWDGLYLQTMDHLKDMFKPRPNYKISSFSDYIQYVSKTVLPGLDRRVFYNGDTIMSQSIWKQEMGFVQDYSNRVMGYPRMRQQRVSEDSCKVSSVMANIFAQCNAPMTLSNMDKKKYATHWAQPDKFSPDADSPWAFSESHSPSVLCGRTTAKCYFPGGYTIKLSYNTTQSINTLTTLLQSEWLDGLTRVVFFEMVIYSVNSELICYVTPMLEKLADGSFHICIKSSILHPRSSSHTATLMVLMFFTFYYFLRIVLNFNRNGFSYLLSWIGGLDVFLNLLLYVAMMSLSFYRQARLSYLHQWQLREEEDLQMSTDIFLHRDFLRYETAVLVIVIPAQLLHGFRFGKRIALSFKRITHSFSVLFVLLVIVLAYHIPYVLVGFINNYRSDFCPFNKCFSTTSYLELNGVYSPFSEQVRSSVLFCFIFNAITFLACVTTICLYREIVARFAYSTHFNMFIFIFERFKHLKSSLQRMRRKLTSYAAKRTRAGGSEPITNDFSYSSNKSFANTEQMCKELTLKFDTILEKILQLN